MRSKQETIKKLIKEFLKDGEERTVKEIRDYVEKHEVRIKKEESTLRNALFNLKKEEPSLQNIARGIYVWRVPQKESFDEKQTKKDRRCDFSDFVTISPSTKKEIELVVSIFEDGTFSLNSYLLKYFPQYTAEIKLKIDCSQLVLIKNGIQKISLGKNGRIKNYNIIKKLKDKKKKFPIYYVGEWDDQNEWWIGNMVSVNPNKPRKR